MPPPPVEPPARGTSWLKWSWLVVLAVVIVQSLDYHWRSLPTTAAGYYSRGRGDYLHGHYDDAIANFTRALERDPDDADVRSWRGEAYVKVHDLSRAMADLNKAVALRPGYEKARAALADGKAAAWDKTGAIEEYTRALAISPDYSKCYLARGALFFDVGRYDQAVTDLRQGTQLLLEDKQVTAALLLWLARASAGDAAGATAELEDLARRKQVRGARFMTAARFLAGETDEPKFLAEHGDACEASYLAGAKRILSGDGAGAAPLLRKALGACDEDFYAHERARAALESRLLGFRSTWIDDDRGMMAVAFVRPGSPVAAAGLQTGTIVAQLDGGRATQSTVNAILSNPPGEKIDLLLVDPADWHPKARLSFKPDSSAPTR